MELQVFHRSFKNVSFGGKREKTRRVFVDFAVSCLPKIKYHSSEKQVCSRKLSHRPYFIGGEDQVVIRLGVPGCNMNENKV